MKMNVIKQIKVFDKKRQTENSKLKPAIKRWLQTKQSTPYEWNKNWGSGIGKAGRPDVEIIARGKTYYFELKDEKGKLSTNQLRVIERYQALGETVYVVKELAEFIEIWRGVVEKVN